MKARGLSFCILSVVASLSLFLSGCVNTAITNSATGSIGCPECKGSSTDTSSGTDDSVVDFSLSTLSLSSAQVAMTNTVDVTLTVISNSAAAVTALTTADISFVLSNNSSASVQSITKSSDGVFVGHLLANAATSSVVISAKVNGTLINATKSLEILSYPLSPTLSTMVVSGGASATVTANSTVNIDIQLRDTNGGTTSLTGRTVTLTASSGTGMSTGSLSTVASLGAGAYRATFRGVKAGTPVTYTATAMGVALTSPSIAITVTPGSAARMVVSAGNNQSAKVSTTTLSTLPVQPTINVVDSQGNAVSGVSTTWTLAAGEGSLTASLTPAVLTTDVVSDASGNASVNWTMPTTLGARTLTVTSTGLSSVTFNATSTVGDPSSFAMDTNSGTGQIAAVGTVLPLPLICVVKDASGNALANRTITWAPGADAGSVSASSTVTDSSGKAQVNWTLGGVIGSQSVVATVAGSSPALTLTYTATVTVGPLDHIRITDGNAQTAQTRTTLPTTLVAETRDAFENPLPGITVAWSLPTGQGGSFPSKTTTSDSSGRVTATWTLGSTTGAQIATVTSSAATGSKTISFNATATTRSVKTLTITSTTNNKSYALGTAITTPMKVRALDSGGVAVIGVDVIWTVTDGKTGGVVDTGTSTTDSSGYATMGYTMGTLIGANTITTTVGAADQPAPPTAAPSATFTLTGSWDSDASTYFTRVGMTSDVEPVLSNKYFVNSFIQRMKSTGLFAKLNDVWLMKQSFNNKGGASTIVYPILHSSGFNGTMTGGPTWDATGVRSTGTGSPPPYVQLAGTQRSAYSQRTIVASLTVDQVAVGGNVYATSSTYDFQADSTGEGFRLGDIIGWGNKDVFATVSQPVLGTAAEHMLTTTIKDSEVTSYMDGSAKLRTSITSTSITDSSTIRLMADQSATLTDRGLNGTMAFFADFNLALTETEVGNLYTIYSETIGQ